jgi:hypothetical protein
LDNLEQYYIDYYDSFHNGYNSTTGGKSGLLSEETKQKIGQSLLGRPMSALTKEKFTFKGHHVSEENKRIISQKAKERFKNKENHPMFGKHHTEASKLKNSKSRKGKCSGANHSQAVAVDQYTLDGQYIQTFACMKDAVASLGKQNKDTTGISNCCRNKQKTSYGYMWTYSNK